MYVFGRSSDTLGRKRFITFGMVGSGLFAVIAALAPLLNSSFSRAAVVGIAFVTLAVTFSAMRTGSIAFVGDISPDERESELMGLLSTAKGIGALVGPPLLGVVATITSFQAAFAGGSVLAFVGAALVGVTLVEPGLGTM